MALPYVVDICTAKLKVSLISEFRIFVVRKAAEGA